MRERLLLQITVAVGGIVPVAAGAAGVLFGPNLLATTHDIAADSHFRYLSGLLIGIGFGFWSTIPRIEGNGARFKLLTLVVIVGGMARLFSLAAVGIPPVEMLGALFMELAVTPLLCFWQWRVSRKFTFVNGNLASHGKHLVQPRTR